MGRFLRYVTAVGLVTIVVLCVLDWGMTLAHKRAKNRGVFARLRHNPEMHMDYVVIGSSRVACHIDPLLILSETGQSGVNLGRLGCGSDEALLLTKLFFKNGNRAKRLFYQVDFSWEETDPQPKPMAAAMPFIREPLFRDHYREWSGFARLYYLPFFRYARFSPEIGFRESLMAIVKDSSSFDQDRGFSPVDSSFRGSETFKVTLKSPANPKIDAIIALCQKHDCPPEFFTAPFLEIEGSDFESFLTPKLPDYRDFSKALPDKQWFRDAGHLNRAGAEKFTEIFIENYFKSEQLME
ncbi:MAG: hypothetical protein ACI9R3_000015 [Verrucomicrobiales bacterium]|jgi:hypothetical protein